MTEHTGTSEKIWALIPAAGIGSRMGSEIPKQYLEIGNKTVLEHTLELFINHDSIDTIIVVLHPGDRYWESLSVSLNPKIVTITGGDERVDSVFFGLEKIQLMGGKNDWVMVHDAARPCLFRQHIDNLILAKCTSPEGAILAVPSFDTVKVTNNQQSIDKTIPRETIWLAQTPQFFPVDLLQSSISKSKADGVTVTDESSAMEAQGFSPALVVGSKRNIKITEHEDLILASLSLSSSMF